MASGRRIPFFGWLSRFGVRVWLVLLGLIIISGLDRVCGMGDGVWQ